MIFNDATISFHLKKSAECSLFRIHSESAVNMTVSGHLRYTYLKLNLDETQKINPLAAEMFSQHEKGLEGTGLMVKIFRPSQIKAVDSSCEATSEEKETFGQIFDIANIAITTQIGYLINPDDVTTITLEKTVNFSPLEAQRACRLTIELSQSAADRLGMDKDGRFRKQHTGSHDDEFYL